MTDSKLWRRPIRTTPQCVFIDLGAGSGKNLEAWTSNKYGPVANCPGGKWEAILVEANPLFEPVLKKVSEKWSSMVTLDVSTAAYMCESKTAFYLDTKDVQKNVWGSGLNAQNQEMLGPGLNKVEVATININKLLTENTIPGDWVMMNMDVEGAEFDIIPCMAQSPAASLVDRLYMEQHDPSWGLEGATPATMQTALAGLRIRGVDIPMYSPTAR
eukprot:CAMPEP_0197650192 /NCGR_PEP_ID=MMETSP1338-20131121/30792_1 /TAXON_ID=43686 ORGANISM="Pelagodinium beii, Strain RCC1491" /NCGR_SAMPLE_ID=MMETSP1338 /ASSEMBLY_ACC=CAM_ASM_000754 /LENGTH=214 /DNA_ID=CAMNT_0043224545 /DNA_START=228 /DNA_END=872 /DNA_ORIENTATION=+